MTTQVVLDSYYRDRDNYPLSTDFVIEPKEYSLNVVNKQVLYQNPIAITYPNLHSGYGANGFNYLTISGPIGSPIFPSYINFSLDCTVINYFSQYAIDVYYPPAAFASIVNQNNFANCTLVTRLASKPAGTYLKAEIEASVVVPLAYQTGTILYPPVTVPYTRLLLKHPGLVPYTPTGGTHSWTDGSRGDPFCIFNNAPNSMYILPPLIPPQTNSLTQVYLNRTYTKIPVNIYDANGNLIGASITADGTPNKQTFVMFTDTDDVSSANVFGGSGLQVLNRNRGQAREIIYYENTSGLAKLKKPLPEAFPDPSIYASDISFGFSYEVYEALYEGKGSMWYNYGIKDPCYTQCRTVTLSHIVLPNIPLDNGPRGLLDNTQYVVAYIYNEGGQNTAGSSLSTNNIDIIGSTYAIPMALSLNNQKFFTLTPVSSKKFLLDFNRPIRVKLTLFNGEVIIFAGSGVNGNWETNGFPFFLKSIPDPNYTDIYQAVRYPGYSPDTPVPFSPFYLYQTVVVLNVLP